MIMTCKCKCSACNKAELGETWFDIIIQTSKDASRVRISNRLSEHLEQDTILDMEKKKRGRLKSLAPGMERYSVYDQDAIANADDDDDDDLYDDATEAEFPDEWADNEEMELLNSKVADINIMGSSNSGAEQDTNLVHKTTPHSANAENVETNHLHPRSSDSGSLTEVMIEQLNGRP